MARKSGLEAALEEDGITPGAALARAEPVAGDLFSDEALTDEDELAEAMFPGIRARAVGRPKGARNRNTEEVRKYVQAMGADPVMAAARVVAAGPAFVMEQARAMKPGSGMDPDKAWAIWARMVEFLGPYTHSKQPVQIDAGGDGQRTLVQIIMGHTAGAAPPAIVGGQQADPINPMISVTCVDDASEVSHLAPQSDPETLGVSDA